MATYIGASAVGGARDREATVNMLDRASRATTADPIGVEQAHIHVVDDDAPVRDALARLLRSGDYLVSAFPSAESFLADAEPDSHGCVILDFAMPGSNGLALQQTLFDTGIPLRYPSSS